MLNRLARRRGARLLVCALALGLAPVVPVSAAVRTVSLGVEIAREQHPDTDTCDDARDEFLGNLCYARLAREVHLRVTVVNRGRTIARRGDLLIEVSSTAPVSVVGRRGFGSCEPASPARCVNTLQLGSRGDEASILVLVRADQAPDATGRAGAGRTADVTVTVRPARGLERTLRLTATTVKRTSVTNPDWKPAPTSPPVQAPAPAAPAPSWAGTWHWKATRTDTKQVFEAEPMTIAESGAVVCATWPFGGGGRAKGSMAGGTWSATWSDPFSSGTWDLTLQGPDRFTGSQTRTDKATKAEERYEVEGTRRTRGASVDCATVKP